MCTESTEDDFEKITMFYVYFCPVFVSNYLFHFKNVNFFMLFCEILPVSVERKCFEHVYEEKNPTFSVQLTV